MRAAAVLALAAYATKEMQERESLLQSEVGSPLPKHCSPSAVACAHGKLVQRESTWRAEGSAEAQRASEAAAVQDQVGFRARAPDSKVAWSLRHGRGHRFSPAWRRWKGPWPRWWGTAFPRARVRCPAPCSSLRGKARATDTHQALMTYCILQATLPRWQEARSRPMPAPLHAQLRLARQA